MTDKHTPGPVSRAMLDAAMLERIAAAVAVPHDSALCSVAGRIRERVTTHDKLAKALTKLMQHFPTDDDMQAAGWNKSEVNEACDAYEAAHAVLSKALGLEGEQQ